MAVSICVRLLDGRYDAAGDDPKAPEWPPHPARLFCALVASAVDEEDWRALRWLERQDLPQVLAGAEVAVARTNGYVVTNAIEKTGSQTWPARTNGLRQRVGTLPALDTVATVWPAAAPDDVTLARLVRLARRVPYLGRSTSPVEVTVTAGVANRRDGWTRYVPVSIGTPGSLAIRVPFPGYLDALDDVYRDGARSWQVGRSVAYAAEDERPSSTPDVSADEPFSELLLWGIARPSVEIGGDDLLTVTSALRRAVMCRVADPLPAQVSGHGADGRPHVAYLALPDVGHRHADGHLLGVGAAIPRDMPHSDRQRLLRGLLGPRADAPMTELRDARGRTLTLAYPPTTWGLQPWRWSREATRWETVTPLMLDRYPTAQADAAECVAGSLAQAGYPRPASVEVLVQPSITGAVARPRRGTVPRYARKPMVHCRVQFSHRVRGPVLAGALRYLGSGLFAPEADHADR